MSQSRKKRWSAAGAVVLGAATIGVGVTSAPGFPRYNDGCQNCHGAFTSSVSPQGTVFPSGGKHTMHRGSSYMNTECDLCHSDGDNDNPFLYFSNGTGSNPGLGCIGCHGRDYGGTVGVSGVGLRAHHTLHNVTECALCHFDDPTPIGENVVPTYYGTVDTNADDPCNAGPAFLENWSLDTDNTNGLDNDGDDLYDGDDPDCAAACPWDCADGDGGVGIVDFLQLLAEWNQVGTSCDFDGGGVGIVDFLKLLANWGPCP